MLSPQVVPVNALMTLSLLLTLVVSWSMCGPHPSFLSNMMPRNLTSSALGTGVFLIEMVMSEGLASLLLEKRIHEDFGADILNPHTVRVPSSWSR